MANNHSGEDLAKLLAARYDLDYRPNNYYVRADDLSEVQWLIGDSGALSDGTPLRVHEHGVHYSIVDPDENPMSFVVEFQFKTGTRYLEVYGHYVSHDGGYWDGYHEVKPSTKTIKVFE